MFRHTLDIAAIFRLLILSPHDQPYGTAGGAFPVIEPLKQIVKNLHQHDFDHCSMCYDEKIVEPVAVDAFYEGRYADENIQW